MSVDTKNILEKVVEIVSEHMGVDESAIKSESRFKEDLGADSLDSVELMMSIEEAFDVNISEGVAEKIKSIQDVVDYIKNS